MGAIHRTGWRAGVCCASALMLASCRGGDVAQVLPLLGYVPMAALAHTRSEEPPPAATVLVLGYDVFVADDFIHWHECTARDTCGHVERSRRFSSLVSMKRVGQATVDGRDVDVLRLEFPPASGP